MDRVYSRAPPSSSRGSTGPTRGKPPWEGRWGRLREDDGGEGQRRSEAGELTNPTPDARGGAGQGNSRTFGRLTCHAAGLLGDGALGHRVEAAGQRGRGAENTGHGLAAEDRSRECDPMGAKYPGSRGLKPDSRVQGSIARHPSASRAAKSCRRQDKSTRENSVVKVRQTVLLEPSLLDTPGDSIRS